MRVKKAQYEQIKTKLQLKNISHQLDKMRLLSHNEKKKCIQYGNWGIPVAIIAEGSEEQFIFTHEDTYFGEDKELLEFMKEKTRHLDYSNRHHIRCSKIEEHNGKQHLKTEWVEYAWYLGTNSQLRNSYNEWQTLREYLKVDASKNITPALLGNELAAVATFIIEENHKKFLLLTMRGSKVHTYPNSMSTSVSGAMGGEEKWLDFIKEESNQDSIPSPIETIIREGYEELGIQINKDELTIDALSLQMEDMQLNFLISGILTHDRETIRKSIVNAEDKYEIEGEEPLFVPFKLKEIVPLLVYLEWSPTSAASVILTLEKHFGKLTVKKEFLNFIENM